MIEVRRWNNIRTIGMSKIEIYADTLTVDIIELLVEWMEHNDDTHQAMKEFQRLLELKYQ